MKLLVDENVAGLARWLRFLGYDTWVVKPGTLDKEVLKSIQKEARLLITRDGVLAGSLPSPQVILVTMDKIVEQLRAVLDKIATKGFKSESKDWFSRCTRCNAPLSDLSEEEMRYDVRIPEFAKEGWSCPECGRAYWKGSHYIRTKKFLENLLK